MDLRAELPFELPDGDLITIGEQELGTDSAPLLWVSRASPPPRTWARARQAHVETGWWPLLLRLPHYAEDGLSAWEDEELFMPDLNTTEVPDVGELLARKWSGYTAVDPAYDGLTPEQRHAVTAPFGAVWPGLAPAGDFEDGEANEAAERCAAELATKPGTRLGLARADSGAAVVSGLGWDSPVNYGLDPTDTAAILADWERRFGVRVLMIQGATLVVSTATVPSDEEQALRLAAEHFAFCPDNIWQSTVGSVAEYARSLIGREIWSFWWD